MGDIKEILLLGFYPAADMASFVTEMNREYKVSYVRSANRRTLHVVGDHPVPAGVRPPRYSWRSASLQGPDPGRSSGGFHRHERRCVCRLPAAADATVPQVGMAEEKKLFFITN